MAHIQVAEGRLASSVRWHITSVLLVAHMGRSLLGFLRNGVRHFLLRPLECPVRIISVLHVLQAVLRVGTDALLLRPPLHLLEVVVVTRSLLDFNSSLVPALVLDTWIILLLNKTSSLWSCILNVVQRHRRQVS